MKTEVYVDNLFVGYVEDPISFVNNVKESRRKGQLPNFINIYYEEKSNTIYINTRKGRLLRPLIVVKNGKPLLDDKILEKLKSGELKWSDLERMGIIEWLDASEEENANIAIDLNSINEKTTHLEISPLLIFGIVTSLTPYSNHNQSARLNRGVRPQKQSHSIYTMNFMNRFDTDISVLYYPQEPMVQTFTNNLFKKENMIGQNVIIAVMTGQGYNMDDSIIINKGSIERGLFRSTYFRSYEIEKVRYSGGLEDEIGIPDQSVYLYKGKERYKYLEEDGIVYLESFVEGGDVLVGRVSPPRFIGLSSESLATGLQKRDTSLLLRFEEKGFIDSVVLTESKDGNTLIKVRVRDPRIPEIGDKLSLRHGQKGVIGLLLDESDMPWTASGLKPDIIFSPFGIPSRMTVGLLLEILGAKVGALEGRTIDGTPWFGEKEEDLRKLLLSYGFRDDGTETMYNPLTGEEYKVRIFIGSAYYLRLKHMAQNKLHARSTGPVALLTKQPTEGKSKEGGLRFGEMEQQVIAAHGASLLLRERLSSDDTYIYVCENCGGIAEEDDIHHTIKCPICGETEKISKIKVSYAFFLLTRELMSLGVWPKLKLKYKFE